MARWTAVQSRLDFGSGTDTADRIADLRAQLGIKASVSDDTITLALNAALRAADEFLNNPFYQRDWSDESSATFGCYVEPYAEEPIPDEVALGVKALVDLDLNGRISSEQTIGVGQWTVTRYSQPEQIRARIKQNFWGTYRLTPGF